METCFVIQPFDRGKFDKRYRDCFKPAIEGANLYPYRVDADLGADVVISAIEDGIRSASACLADITLDNANVWYELGCALALGKPVVMVCAEERLRFPFDIQHRSVKKWGQRTFAFETNLFSDPFDQHSMVNVLNLMTGKYSWYNPLPGSGH